MFWFNDKGSLCFAKHFNMYTFFYIYKYYKFHSAYTFFQIIFFCAYLWENQ